MARKSLVEQGIHHLGFVVKDLNGAVKQLEEVYGASDFLIYDFEPGAAWSYGERVDRYILKIAMGTLGDTGLHVEVIQPIAGEGVHSDFVKNGGGGLHHICFSAGTEYEYWLEYYRKSGMRMVFESETEDEAIGYRRCFYAEDKASGMIVEVKETPYFRNERKDEDK